MLIDGIGISSYRSFGNDLQRIGPFSKVNLFIGQNNSGKSNILLFLTHHYRKAFDLARGGRIEWKLEPVDRHLGETSGPVRVAFGLTLDGEKHKAVLSKHERTLDNRFSEFARRILKSETLAKDTNVAWFSYEAPEGNLADLSLSRDMVRGIREEQVLTDNEWANLWRRLTRARGGSIDSHWIPGTLGKLRPVQFEPPQVSLIPAIRRIGNEGLLATSNDYSGVNIIDRLARLQSPDYDQQDLRVRFDTIRQFLREVTGNPTATLDIPYERDKILVRIDDKTLPLSNLGMGIHEVIILAAAATLLSDQVICIEEPELHLHPLLQKKLVRYLQDKTDNQYFMSTHSAHLLDTPGAAIFHVRLRHGQSIVELASTDTEKFLICADLGYRASDLLQANCILWVEGPSDRIYLNHWIRALDASLVEGVHYSIMFYGGRLLSHLSADDSEVEDFISLRRLNRNLVVVMDSDRSDPDQPINQTKERIGDEFDEGPGFAWITQGREIENYIGAEVLDEAVKKVHPGASRLESTGPYDHCLSYKTADGAVRDSADKVKVARAVAEGSPDFQVLDLKQMVEKVVQFIRESNDVD